ncbi:unknown [Acholeplasma sp. CAG:878]|nr:unknown [Acholeplasma sp. CAG:878]
MNSVYAITNKLLSCQKELYELELNGLKNTPLGQSLILQMKKLLEEEENIYKNLNLSLKEIDGIIQKHIKVIQSISDEFEKAYYKRILIKLVCVQNNRNQKQISELFGGLEVTNGTKIQNKIFKCLGFLYFSILEEYISDPAYASIKDQLLKNKYTLSFVHPDLEKAMVDTNFDIPDDIYNDIYFEGQLSNLPIAASTKLTDIELFKSIESATTDLLTPKKLGAFQIISHICLVRAALAIMSDKGRSDYIEIVNSLLNDNDLYISDFQKQYLLKGIGSYNVDRRKVKIISLGINIE